ncbi:hypothetical protein VTH82DRAFT_2017 [Thermothelomyces myriococcoides]
MAEITQRVLELWHEHRIPIIMSTLFVLGLLRLYLHLTDDRLASRKQPDFDKKTSQDVSIGALEKPKIVISKNEDSEGSESAETGNSKGTTRQGPKRIKGDISKKKKREIAETVSEGRKIQALIFYSSLTASTEKISRTFSQELGASLGCSAEKEPGGRFLAPRVLDLAEIDFDDYFITPPKSESEPTSYFYLFIIPSYNIDSINDTFLEHLRETHHDFRIDTSPLSPILGYSVFGLGDREGWPTEEEGFCFQAKEVDKWMAKLSGLAWSTSSSIWSRRAPWERVCRAPEIP